MAALTQEKNIQLCSNCNDDARTLSNMQCIIIPALQKDAEDLRVTIATLKDVGADIDMVGSFCKRRDVVESAIARFYERFPAYK